MHQIAKKLAIVGAILCVAIHTACTIEALPSSKEYVPVATPAVLSPRDPWPQKETAPSTTEEAPSIEQEDMADFKNSQHAASLPATEQESQAAVKNAVNRLLGSNVLQCQDFLCFVVESELAGYWQNGVYVWDQSGMAYQVFQGYAYELQRYGSSLFFVAYAIDFDGEKYVEEQQAFLYCYDFDTETLTKYLEQPIREFLIVNDLLLYRDYEETIWTKQLDCHSQDALLLEEGLDIVGYAKPYFIFQNWEGIVLYNVDTHLREALDYGNRFVSLDCDAIYFTAANHNEDGTEEQYDLFRFDLSEKTLEKRSEKLPAYYFCVDETYTYRVMPSLTGKSHSKLRIQEHASSSNKWYKAPITKDITRMALLDDTLLCVHWGDESEANYDYVWYFFDVRTRKVVKKVNVWGIFPDPD